MSVSYTHLGLNPFKTNLVVAYPTRSKSTICLAITPAMKSLGIKNRCQIQALKVKTTFLPDTSAVTSLARVGLAFEMPYAYKRFLIWDVVNMKLI